MIIRMYYIPGPVTENGGTCLLPECKNCFTFLAKSCTSSFILFSIQVVLVEVSFNSPFNWVIHSNVLVPLPLKFFLRLCD